MPIISADELGESYEDKTAPEGIYDLRIAKVDVKRTKKDDRDMVVCMIVIDGADGEGIAPVNEFLLIPNDHEEPKTKRMFMQRLTRFLRSFGAPLDGFDTESAAELLTGLTAKVPLILEEGDDGVVRNRMKLPRVG